MTTKSLELIFKFVQILGVAPLYKKPKLSTAQKVYCILLFTAIGTALAVTIYNRNFYREKEIHIKIAVSALLDMNSLSFNFCTIVMNVLKNDQWRKLIFHLKIIVSNIERPRKTITIFVMSQVIAVVIIGMSFKTWFNIYKAWFITEYNIQYVQYYLLFAHNTFAGLIVSLILNAYKKVHRTLKEVSKDKYHVEVLLVVMKLDDFLYFLKDAVDAFNEIFAWSIFFSVFYVSLHILNMSYSIFSNTSFYKMNHSRVGQVIAELTVALLLFVGIIVLIFLCDLTSTEMEKILSFSHRLQRKYKNSMPQVEEELYEFSKSAVDNFPKFSGAGFFIMNRSVVLSILGTVTTFLIIMIQFRLNDHP